MLQTATPLRAVPQFDVPVTKVTKVEEVAQRIVSGLGVAKLASIRKDVAFVKAGFKKLEPGQTILGCKSWAEFCWEQLGNRGTNGVDKMLAGPRKPAKPLSRERQVRMAISNLDRLVPGWTTRDGLVQAGGIVERSATLLAPRSRFGRMVDFVKGTRAA